LRLRLNLNLDLNLNLVLNPALNRALFQKPFRKPLEKPNPALCGRLNGFKYRSLLGLANRAPCGKTRPPGQRVGR
jgi:hypothetical protein